MEQHAADTPDARLTTDDESASPLRVLIIEDEPVDAYLMIDALKSGGLDMRSDTVDTEAAFRVALRTHPDVVLADYSVPGFGAVPALAILAEEAPDIPLLVVSGTINDEAAVATLGAGAADFLLKDRIGRLASAVSAAVERHRLQRERDRAEQRLHSLAANMSDLLFSVRLRPLTVEYVTPSVLAFSGYSEAEVRRNPHLFPLFQPEVVSAMATTGLRETAYEIGETGRKVWVEVRGTPLLGEHGDIAGFQGVARDVSDARSAREVLALRARQWSVVAGLTQDVLEGASLDAVVWKVAGGLSHALGVEFTEVLQRDIETGDLRLRAGVGWEARLFDTVVHRGDEDGHAPFTLATEEPVVLLDAARENRFPLDPLLAEHQITCGVAAVVRGTSRHAYGVLGAHSVRRRPFTVDDVNFLQTVANVLTSCLQREDTTRQLAATTVADPVTGLPKRDHLLQGLGDLLTQATGDRPAVVAAINIDRYTDVRDAFGQATADRFLGTMARRLWQATDSGDLVAAHEPGHLYAVHLTNPETESAGQFAERLLDAFDEPAYLSGRELRTSGSVGVVRTTRPPPEVEELLRHADVAMRRAVELGGDTTEEYAGEQDDTRRVRLDRTVDLRRAIDSDEIRVLYQPVVDLRTRMVVGAEALARWDHPEMGLLTPHYFLPAADDAGLTPEIGRAVQSRAWETLSSWGASAVLAGLHVAINVSPRELAHPEFAARFLQGLREANVSPARIWLELTEESITDGAFMPTLHELRDQGVTLAIDDFGTHYSSLARVRDTQPGLLKIDQSFIADVDARPSNRSLVDATVNIAAAVGARTVAEGVETASQARGVAEAGCDLAQGFHFSPPLSRSDFEELVIARSGVLVLTHDRAAPSDDPEERR